MVAVVEIDKDNAAFGLVADGMVPDVANVVADAIISLPSISHVTEFVLPPLQIIFSRSPIL